MDSAVEVAVVGGAATIGASFMAYLGVRANGANKAATRAAGAAEDAGTAASGAAAAADAQRVALEGLRALIREQRDEIVQLRADLDAERLERERATERLAKLERLYNEALEQLDSCLERITHLEGATP